MQVQRCVHENLPKGWTGAIQKLRQHLAAGQKAKMPWQHLHSTAPEKVKICSCLLLKQLSVEGVPYVWMPQGIVRGWKREGCIYNEKTHLK